MQVLESSQGVLVLISRPASKLQPTFPGVSSEGIRYHELPNSSSCARAVHGLSGTSSLSIARECVSTCATAVHTRPSDASDLTCRSAPCRVSCCSGARVTFCSSQHLLSALKKGLPCSTYEDKCKRASDCAGRDRSAGSRRRQSSPKQPQAYPTPNQATSNHHYNQQHRLQQ